MHSSAEIAVKYVLSRVDIDLESLYQAMTPTQAMQMPRQSRAQMGAGELGTEGLPWS